MANKQQEIQDLKKQIEAKTRDLETMRKRLEMRDVQLSELMKDVESASEKEVCLQYIF